MNQFAPRIYDKKTGETFRVMSINYYDPPEIYLVKDINTREPARDADGNSIAYTDTKGLIGTKGWRDISDVEMLIPTGLYDDNEEMIYVASFEELHELFFKFMSLDKRFIEGISTKELVGIHEKYGKKEDKQ